MALILQHDDSAAAVDTEATFCCVNDSGPKISIVAATLNSARVLRENLESVLSQKYRNIETIVIDGGSTDGTLEILAEYGDRLSYWSSGPDRGISDAMNKGIQQATGDFVLFLHSDDRFASASSLANAVNAIDDERPAVWAFDVLFQTPSGFKRLTPRPFNWWTNFKNPLPHQGVLCPRGLFAELGKFDTELHVEMDYEFWLRAYRRGVTVKTIRGVLAVMGDTGVSSRRDWSSLQRRFQEERAIHERYARNWLWRVVYRTYWPMYFTYRAIRHLAAPK
jgi:glycosyltransferase involved in cell wall biosynthesis